jgi:hypothetical protein
MEELTDKLHSIYKLGNAITWNEKATPIIIEKLTIND